MILVHSSPVTLEGYRAPNLGVLSSPRRFYTSVEGWPWAADNDAFSAWDEKRFVYMLEQLAGIPGCLFVTAPDVVGDARATLELFHQWAPRIKETGLPVALVAQDGIEEEDIPWDEVDALFIGGTSVFKMGEKASYEAREAKRRGKWVHMGRVSSYQRVTYAKAIGCDSMDGTRFSWFKDLYLREYLKAASGPIQETFI